MLALTRKTDYALVALVALHEREPISISARDLAQAVSLPLPVLRNVLKRLAQAGLLCSTQGSSGGYRLALPPERISLLNVVEAIEGPIRLARCCSDDVAGEGEACGIETSCRIRTMIRVIHGHLNEYLAAVTLAHLLADADLVGADMVGAGLQGCSCGCGVSVGTDLIR